MKRYSLLLLLCITTLCSNAVSLGKLRSFFSESYVLGYFKYAHPNANYEGVSLGEVTENRVTVKISFSPTSVGRLWGAITGGSTSTYTCYINVYIDNGGKFISVESDCNSSGKNKWPCFHYAKSELISKCRSMSSSRYIINVMTEYYGKSFTEFSGSQLMCTLLNIAWYNYDY